MFSQVDTDQSGFIDYSEFVIAAMNAKTVTTKEKLEAAFNMFDKDGSGIITADAERSLGQVIRAKGKELSLNS